MNVAQNWLRGVFLIAFCGSANAATDWDRLVPAESRINAPISKTLLSSDDRGWWALAESGDEFRPRTLARFDYGSSVPIALKYLQPNFRVTAISAAADGGVYLVDGTDRDNFGGYAERYSVLQSRDSQGNLIWERTLRGLCEAPIVSLESSAAESISLLCDYRIYGLSKAGETLSDLALVDVFERGYLPELSVERLADGGTLIVSTGAVAVINPDGSKRWQRQFTEPAVSAQASGSHIFLQFGNESAQIRVLLAADGSDSGQALIPGTVSAGVVWQQQLWLAVSADGQVQFIALNAAAEIVDNQSLAAGSTVLAMAVSLGNRAEQTLLAGLNAGNGTLALLRLQTNGNLGIRTLTNAAQPLRLLGAPLGGALVAHALAGSAQQSLGVSVLGSSGAPLSAIVQTLPSPLVGEGVIDGGASELWQSGLLGSPTNPVLYLGQTDFEGGGWTADGRSVTSFSRPGVVTQPVLTNIGACALHSPSPTAPQREDMSHLFCVDRLEPATARLTDVRLTGPNPRLIGLGTNAAGDSVILSRTLNSVNAPVWRAVVDAIGEVDYQSPSLSYSPPVVLKPDLSGLLGNSLIDELAEIVVDVGGIELASQPLTGIWLSDGDLVLLSQDLQVTTTIVDPLSSGRIERVSPTGDVRWSVPLPFPATISTGSLRLAANSNVVSLDVAADLGREPTRLVFDLQTGSTLRTELSPRLNSGVYTFLSLPETDGTQRLWRMIGLSTGLLAEPIWPPAESRVWLPCELDGCVVRAVGADPSGRALVQLEGPLDRESKSNLGTADLNQLLKLPAPVGPPAEGIWRRDGDANQGLVVGRRPGDQQRQTMLVELTNVSDFETPAIARWWTLRPVLANSGARDYDLVAPPAADFPRPAGQRGSATPRRASLYPLADAGWLLSLSETFPPPFPQRFNELYFDRLQRADSGNARVYFASDDNWLALDLNQGRGVWGRPNGRWLSLQRLPSGDWQFSDPSRPAAIDGPVPNPRALGSARLQSTSCSTLSWRVKQTTAQASGQFASDFRATNFTAGSCL